MTTRVFWATTQLGKRRHRGMALASVVLMLAACPSVAQEALRETAAPPLPHGVSALGLVTTERSDRYRFESEIVGKPFIIEVVRIDAPFAPPSQDTRLPVVFVTDNHFFSTLVPAMVGVGSIELFPSMIIVGVGYDLSAAANPAEAFVLGAARRATDFTPIFDEAYLAGVVPFTEQVLGLPWPEDESLGGADSFLAFINDELKPFVAARYPADVQDATLIGHSLGGLFTLHALFTSPDSFKRYVALSPAAHYGDEILLRELAELDGASARLFLGVGSEDTPEILESTSRLHPQIEARALHGLAYTYKVFPGETHASVLATGLMTGLRAVFDAPPVPGIPDASAQE